VVDAFVGALVLNRSFAREHLTIASTPRRFALPDGPVPERIANFALLGIVNWSPPVFGVLFNANWLRFPVTHHLRARYLGMTVIGTCSVRSP
jgi:hypothetical protein